MNARRRVALAVLVVLVVLAGPALGSGRARCADPPPPRLVHLTTRPALPAATFVFDGVSYTTGADGTVTILTTHLTDLDQRLALRLGRRRSPNTSAHFDHFEARPELDDTREVVAVFDMSLASCTSPPSPTCPTPPSSSTASRTRRALTAPSRSTPRCSSTSTSACASTRWPPIPSRRRASSGSSTPPQTRYWRQAIASFDVSHAVPLQLHRPERGAGADRARDLHDDPELDR